MNLLRMENECCAIRVVNIIYIIIFEYVLKHSEGFQHSTSHSEGDTRLNTKSIGFDVLRYNCAMNKF